MNQDAEAYFKNETKPDSSMEIVCTNEWERSTINLKLAAQSMAKSNALQLLGFLKF